MLTLHPSINWSLLSFQTIPSGFPTYYTVLFLQLSFLAMENKLLTTKLQQANQDSVVTDHSNAVETKGTASKQDFSTATATTTTCAREIEVDETMFSAAGREVIFVDLLDVETILFISA